MGYGPGNIILGLVCALVTGYLAARKNRSSFWWGLAGFFAVFVAAVVLLFLPTLCPRCRKQPLTGEQAASGFCPDCDGG